MDAVVRREIKVVLLPYIAFGHLIPFYRLGLALAKSNVHVYYFSTPRNINRLPKVPHNLSSHFNFVPIPLPKIPNSPLPESAEASCDIPAEMSQHLIGAYNLLKQPLQDFISDLSPDWLIIDFLPHWAADIARECGVPLISFSAFSAATHVYFGPPEYLSVEKRRQVRSSLEDLTSPPPWVNFPSQVAHSPSEAVGALPVFQSDDPSSLFELFGKILRESKSVAIRTCREIEGEYLTLYADLLGKPVIPVGFLMPEQREPAAAAADDDSQNWTQIFSWLDEQRPKSVVSVGFGSECKPSREQIVAIADGLEESGLPFLWALQKPSWAVEDSDALPAGFVERTDGRGKVCFGWAPQLRILAHAAIGGSLFHAGWGSAIETLQFGHAMVVLPLINDQGLNARLLVEKGLAIEVERNHEDGSFTGKDIAKCLKQAMETATEEKAEERVREMAVVAGDRKLQDEYMDEFVKYLTTSTTTTGTA